MYLVWRSYKKEVYTEIVNNRPAYSNIPNNAFITLQMEAQRKMYNVVWEKKCSKSGQKEINKTISKQTNNWR